jgi:hypothetical protein
MHMETETNPAIADDHPDPLTANIREMNRHNCHDFNVTA